MIYINKWHYTLIIVFTLQPPGFLGGFFFNKRNIMAEKAPTRAEIASALIRLYDHMWQLKLYMQSTALDELDRHNRRAMRRARGQG